MTKRVCISLNDDDANWIEVNNISPSKIIQEEIKKIRSYQGGLKELEFKVQHREEVILKLNETIMALNEKISEMEKNVLEK